MKRTARLAGFLGLAAVLGACGVVGPSNEDTVAYDVKDRVAALRVQTDSGTVEVVESDREGIHVSERLAWRKDKPETSHKVSGDTLELTFTCPTSWGMGAGGVSCDVSYTVEVPKGLRVDVSSDSGDLTLKDLTGAVEAESDSGAVKATGLAGKQVVTKTDSGDVSLAFAGQPDKVTVTTDSGATTVHVPQGPYRIVTKTDSGAEDVTAANDASAARTITLTSDSGDLKVATP